MTSGSMTMRVICITAMLTTAYFFPMHGAFAGSRNDAPNAVDLELAGKCLLYSFSYQRMVAEPVGVEMGVSMLGGGSSGSSSSIIFFTVGGKIYFIQKDASPYIGAGFVSLTASTSSGPFSDSGSGNYGYVTPGFEYRSEGGFLVRGSVYMLFTSGGSFVWPGLTVGIAF
jgi:hypothetical protein